MTTPARKKLNEVQQQLIDLLQITGVYISIREEAAGTYIALVDEETGTWQAWGSNPN
jgi:hypothetical protein